MPSMCPLTKCPPSRSPTRQGPLQVHRAAGPQFAQVGAGQRFRTGLEGERVALDRHDRQAAAVDRDAVGHGGLGGDLLLADDQPAARRLGADFRHAAQGLDDSGKHGWVPQGS